MSNQKEWEILKVSSIKACLALTFRYAFTALVTLVGNLFLVRLMSPADFGVVAIGTMIVKFSNLLEDAGLGASLIRQKDEPRPEEMTVVLIFQLIWAALPFLAILLLAPILAPLFHLGAGSLSVLYWLAGGRFFIGLGGLPLAILHRRMDFAALGKNEILQTVLYYLIAITLGFMEMGALGLAVGSAISQALATGMLFLVSGPTFTSGKLLEGMRKRLKFGMQYQTSLLLDNLRDSVVPLYGGAILGPAAVGQANFALTTGNLPRIFSSIINRSYLPLFAKCQADESLLIKLLEHVLFWSNLFIIGINAVFLPLAPAFIKIVFGEKWLPSLPLLYAYLIGNIVVASIRPLQALIYAIDKAKVNVSFQLAFVLLSWAVTVPLIIIMGLPGIAVAQLILLAAHSLYFIYVRRQIKFALLPAYCLPVLIGSLVSILMAILVGLVSPSDPGQLMLFTLGGFLLWLLLVFALIGDRFKRLCFLVLSIVRSRSYIS